ncbi:hypothetical protein TNCV_1934501 [Trichonephila clavipes]|nr:hypothetical protein TNCV_1934501 [Trichonephila clavipes]
MHTAPIMADKDMLKSYLSSKYIIDADSDGENEKKSSSYSHVNTNEEHHEKHAQLDEHSNCGMTEQNGLH